MSAIESAVPDAGIRLRPAVEADLPVILGFIHALADYERLSDRVTATEDGLRRALFQNRIAQAIIAEYQGEAAGFALFFHNFSTFLGKPGIYIEDIFVTPARRGLGLGKAMLQRVIGLAREWDCGRVEWSCLNWNAPAIAFYQSQGAAPLTDWTTFRVALTP